MTIYLTKHILSFRYNSFCELIRYYILITVYILTLFYIKFKALRFDFFIYVGVVVIGL